ncbi:FtsX-like permease family protein [Rhodococcus sp. BP-252]|uniref:ABC transporter permease n=1 Tax=unclassified Rhodococcus (in: high G+C Gram-positive bacteria) TaxID=192944 RepID=UPI001C9ADF0B|nr:MULTISPECIES: ABC transporter permease [unclassified Rhodococcus (in: high G+C Gram-positive bacteria)]MBY6414740.1 FtsX-like permease family protein [Rhodococcus sp. BP-320]MBY6419644.1 FtsX-like permease family protein [Rhodococcus sp. BP-321]MBY6424636.1 FtsX-like permease family protein [Rhodococcus sp. BP-324]MBY6429633.1 FtsX-like permease family protein [Rhodococcus sp. BP-323]MBY6434590.1 FtsX-like permease family protein [Rhodococcus sp. BP-322]
MRAMTNSSGRREHGASILVTALASFFGVVLIQATAFLLDIFGDDGEGSVAIALYCVAMVFILLALYVAAVVTANTFGTIVAGRTKTIALLRLLGASGRELRRSVSREGLSVGFFGAAVGLVVGVASSHLARAIAVSSGKLPDVAYTTVQPLVATPVVIVVGTTWAASYIGAKRVLDVTPIQATGAVVDVPGGSAPRRTARTASAIVLIAGGVILLGLGVVVGTVTPAGVLVAFAGGAASFTGVMVGARRIVPWLLRVVGRLFGASPSARLASANATRYPERSTRTALGLPIGVTLVVTFSVAMYSYRSMLENEFSAESLDQVLTVTVGIMTGLIGFSGVIAAVGMVNNLSLSVMQRTRELGLLRALGFTRKQIRSMIVSESAQMVIASMGFGLLLGIVYGWAAAQSLLGSIAQSGITVPTLPWAVIAGTVLCAAVLALVASLVPSRRATRISPVVALSEA